MMCKILGRPLGLSAPRHRATHSNRSYLLSLNKIVRLSGTFTSALRTPVPTLNMKIFLRIILQALHSGSLDFSVTACVLDWTTSQDMVVANASVHTCTNAPSVVVVVMARSWNSLRACSRVLFAGKFCSNWSGQDKATAAKLKIKYKNTLMQEDGCRHPNCNEIVHTPGAY